MDVWATKRICYMSTLKLFPKHPLSSLSLSSVCTGASIHHHENWARPRLLRDLPPLHPASTEHGDRTCHPSIDWVLRSVQSHHGLVPCVMKLENLEICHQSCFTPGAAEGNALLGPTPG